MDFNEFSDYYLNELLHQLSSENKSVIFRGDLNMIIIIQQSSFFLFRSHSTQSTRIRDSNKTLIDNIFSNIDRKYHTR